MFKEPAVEAGDRSTDVTPELADQLCVLLGGKPSANAGRRAGLLCDGDFRVGDHGSAGVLNSTSDGRTGNLGRKELEHKEEENNYTNNGRHGAYPHRVAGNSPGLSYCLTTDVIK